MKSNWSFKIINLFHHKYYVLDTSISIAPEILDRETRYIVIKTSSCFLFWPFLNLYGCQLTHPTLGFKIFTDSRWRENIWLISPVFPSKLFNEFLFSKFYFKLGWLLFKIDWLFHYLVFIGYSICEIGFSYNCN